MVWSHSRSGSRPRRCPKPRRRSWLRKQSARGPPTAITIRVVSTGRRRGPFVLVLSPLLLVKLSSGGFGASNATTAGPLLPGDPNWVSLVVDQLPQRRAGTIEKSIHPLTPTSRIVILAHRLAGLGWNRFQAHAALCDRKVAALITRLQLPIQPQFHAQTLPAHSGLHLRALDLIAVAREGEGVVVADHPLLHVTENCFQIQLRRQRPMMIGEVRHRRCELLIPL